MRVWALRHPCLSLAVSAGFSLAFAGDALACDPAQLDGAAPVRHKVDAVIDGATLALEDGSALRLVDIHVPSGPYADKARSALAALTLKKKLQIVPAQAPRDRYGRLLAQVFVRARGKPALLIWVQGRLVEEGLARVETRKEGRLCAAELLSLEAQARAERRGLWADATYAVRAAGAITPRDFGRFQLVEGRVQAVAIAGGRTYINFGPDWKTDFTVTIAAQDRKLFASGALEPAALKGRMIRVRGYIERLYGPMIAVTHPEQIESLP
jgi:endonuclease YncB( thermonuclease family)